MKILLIAINAKYIHSNLAVYSLRAFADKYADNIKIVELTINHSEEDILKVIAKEKADVAAFSCYIWNIDIVKRITSNLRKIQKQLKIWYGGPEVSYDFNSCLRENHDLDGIMIGEGEETFLEIVSYYVKGTGELNHIKGIAYKPSALLSNQTCTDIIITPARELIELDCIPFPYQKMEQFQNRIIYYESSRGCPFSCSYCLSSIDKKVRLRSIDLVKKELLLFIEHRIPQVKFVDRTFNCNKNHAMEIWRFIKENDNGITNFHFEISADILSEEELKFLAELRPGQVQLEIGVQSTNPETINAVRRKMDFAKLGRNVSRLKEAGNIHQHLDLIAGLPLEDYQSFRKSFGEVYALKPEQLQLGFLKVLKGSLMELESSKYGITYLDTQPYEVLFTNYLSYEELIHIKGICKMVETYYNSLQFTYSIGYLEHFFNEPMDMYSSLCDYYESKGYDMLAHSRLKRYEILLDFFTERVLTLTPQDKKMDEIQLFKEILTYDLLLREGMRHRPAFAPQKLSQGKLRELYASYQKDSRLMHIEAFLYDNIASSQAGRAIRKNSIVLFDYSERDPLSGAARHTIISQDCS